MSKVSEAIEIFHERRKFYKSVDVKIAAVNHEQSWYNIRTKILPSADEAPIISEKIVDVEDFVILHERLNPNEFDRLLQDINTGSLNMNSLKINFFSDPIPSLGLEDYYYRGDSLKAKERWSIEWPLDSYKWEQNHKLQNELDNIFKKIDMQLRHFDPPYTDIEEAVMDLLNLPKYYFQENYSKDSKCSIILPNFIAIESAKLNGNKLEIIARFHESIRLQDLLLSVICYGRKTNRFRENLKTAKAETSSPFVRVSKTFKVKDVADVQLYLFSKKMEKYGLGDQRSARNVQLVLNPCVASHEVFDVGSARLLEWLRGESKRDVKHNFEHSVATLLHMCGFRTEWLDYPGIVQDAPDILAFCSEPKLVIVGECTSEIPDANKYKSLKERAERLQTRLRMDTCAVMFMPIKASFDEQDQPWKYNVSFVGSDKLKELHDMATRDKTVRDMLYILTGRNW